MSETIVIRVEDDNPIRVTVTDVVRIGDGGGGGGGAVDSVNGQTGVVVLDQDDVVDGTTYKQYSGAEKTKLAGVATGATANSSDATLLARGNHTGTQASTTISDFAEAVQDQIGANVAGTGLVSASYNDTSGVTTVSTTATANSSDATLLARANHTGTQSADTLTDGTTNKAFLATERTKLSGIATGATANSSDATLLARANHTGTQTSSTISDFDEAARDAIGAALVAGSNVTITPNDGADTITISATGGGGGGFVPALSPKSGHYIQPAAGETAAGVSAYATNTVQMSPVVIPVSLSVDALAVNVSTGEAIDLRLLLYSSDSDGHPSTLVTSVTVNATSTGNVVGTLGSPVALSAGLYWTAVRSNGGSTVRVTSMIVQQAISPILSGVRSSLSGNARAMLPEGDVGTYASPSATISSWTYNNLGTASYPLVFLRRG